MKTQNTDSVESITTDLSGFLQAGMEDCQEQIFTLDGKEITDEFTK